MLKPNTTRRVRTDLGVFEWYGSLLFTDAMKQFLGKDVTIDMVWTNHGVATIKEDNGKSNWTEAMFEPEPVPVDDGEEMEKAFENAWKLDSDKNGVLRIDAHHFFRVGWKRRGEVK